MTRVAKAYAGSATPGDDANAVIDAFGRARLLTFDRDPLTRGTDGRGGP